MSGEHGADVPSSEELLRRFTPGSSVDVIAGLSDEEKVTASLALDKADELQCDAVTLRRDPDGRIVTTGTFIGGNLVGLREVIESNPDLL